MLALVGAALGLVLAAAGIRLLPVLGRDLLPLGAEIVFDASCHGSRVCFGSSRLRAFAHADRASCRSATDGQFAAVRITRRNCPPRRPAAAPWLRRRADGPFIRAPVRRGTDRPQPEPSDGVSRQASTPGRYRPGFISLPGRRYPRACIDPAFQGGSSTTFARQPGVKAVAVATNVPLSGNNNKSAATVKGYVPPAGDSLHGHYSYGVSGDYFTRWGSRSSKAASRRSTPREAIAFVWSTRRSLAITGSEERSRARDLPRRNRGRQRRAFRVVGVVGAIKQVDVTEDGSQGAVYYPLGHRLDRNLFAVVRTNGSPESFAGTLRAAVRQLDGELPVSDILPMPVRIADSLAAAAPRRFVVGLFSGLALSSPRSAPMGC